MKGFSWQQSSVISGDDPSSFPLLILGPPSPLKLCLPTLQDVGLIHQNSRQKKLPCTREIKERKDRQFCPVSRNNLYTSA